MSFFAKSDPILSQKIINLFEGDLCRPPPGSVVFVEMLMEPCLQFRHVFLHSSLKGVEHIDQGGGDLDHLAVGVDDDGLR